MRINLPSAILLSGTVLLLSAAGVIAKTSDAAKPEASDASATTQKVEEKTTTTTEVTQTQDAAGATKHVAGDPVVPGTTGAKNRGAAFKFGADAEKDAVVDAPEAIEKARTLHAKAMEQAKAKDIPAAIATEKEAIAAAEHYWLPHAGMVYLMMQGDKRRAMDALKEASLSLYGKHGAVAERNSAKLFQQIRWNPPALKALEAAAVMEPDNWKVNLALADLQSNMGASDKALKTLDGIKPEALNSFEVADQVGSRYLAIDQFEKARDVLAKAYALAPTDEDKKDVIDRQFITALKMNDLALLKSTAPQVSEVFKNQRPDLYIEAKVILAETPAQADPVLEQAANLRLPQDKGQVFFAAGRQLSKKALAAEGETRKEWLKKASVAYRNAISRNTSDMAYRVALASTLEQLNDSQAVLQVLSELKESLSPGAEELKLAGLDPVETSKKISDFNKYNLVKAFEPVKDAAPNAIAYRSNARELKYRILKASCACHAKSMKRALVQEPGVLFVGTSKEEKPVVTVIYDGRLNNQKKLMASKIIESLKDPIELVSDNPVETFAQISSVMIEPMDQRPTLIVKRDYTLEMPTETAGQVAQNSEPAVR